MRTIIEIRAGDYHATVDLEMLSNLPARNIRKLLHLLFSNRCNDNSETITTFIGWLPGAVSDAKNAKGYAIALYKDNYRVVKKGSRKKSDVVQRAKNHVFADGVKNAKITYDRLVKLQSIFNEIKEKMNYAY